MAREFSRTDRVGQQVHKEVASILQNEFKHREPDTGFITISSVEVSRDLAHAKIYVTFYGDDEDVINADLVKLKDAKPMVRSLLAKRLRMRSVPDLHFFRDESITEGIRISTLVNQARASDDAKTQGKDEEE
ncbi:30S ribosome-binding factor RbfA [Glaciecola sp. KUL10]|jgi:ribosome-binding factor A|uniref:30S ribosome-binding factor RbfA n=1 Tax=Glaciecola sp. (strain KUL10) TaxID=2161813 RepID=UPI000D786904|nr:30S ribosome-binding factor RbfA [Glaciecola sp. KUL10]GBL03202.1 ribosome-binding factor A [Glaciecola sp. KUL10]